EGMTASPLFSAKQVDQSLAGRLTVGLRILDDVPPAGVRGGPDVSSVIGNKGRRYQHVPRLLILGINAEGHPELHYALGARGLLKPNASGRRPQAAERPHDEPTPFATRTDRDDRLVSDDSQPVIFPQL